MDEDNDPNYHGVEGIKFCPPLWIQRHYYIAKFVESYNINSLLDIGCGSKVQAMRWLKRCGSLLYYIGVDKDQSGLSEEARFAGPQVSDFVFKRETPLKGLIFYADVLNCEFPSSLRNIDCCVLVEVIEHMELVDIDVLVFKVFSHVAPNHIVITTPNKDFNVLFHSNSFRHHDHKFEWSRIEFQAWCLEICTKYNYHVEFHGAGEPPEHETELGYCTQIAVFHQLHPVVRFMDCHFRQISESNSWILVHSFNYPYKRTAASKLIQDLRDVVKNKIATGKYEMKISSTYLLAIDELLPELPSTSPIGIRVLLLINDIPLTSDMDSFYYDAENETGTS